MKKVPNLLKQAGNGIACALRVLFRLYSPDMLDSMADRAAAAAPDGGDREGEGEGSQVLPPDEVQARQELAEGYVALPSLTHSANTRNTHTRARARLFYIGCCLRVCVPTGV